MNPLDLFAGRRDGAADDGAVALSLAGCGDCRRRGACRLAPAADRRADEVRRQSRGAFSAGRLRPCHVSVLIEAPAGRIARARRPRERRRGRDARSAPPRGRCRRGRRGQRDRRAGRCSRAGGRCRSRRPHGCCAASAALNRPRPAAAPAPSLQVRLERAVHSASPYHHGHCGCWESVAMLARLAAAVWGGRRLRMSFQTDRRRGHPVGDRPAGAPAWGSGRRRRRRIASGWPCPRWRARSAR